MKNNNKGFSLVELIVVIAIMAVLVGVLAPTLLRYVEKSRAQKDLSAADEVRNAVQIAIAEEAIYDKVANGTTVTVGDDANITDSLTGHEVANDIVKTVGQKIDFKSKTYNGKTYTITINISADGVTTVTGAFNS